MCYTLLTHLTEHREAFNDVATSVINSGENMGVKIIHTKSVQY